ncbi:MAG: Uma2 family endonuclease [candidate division WOR-3 bacterium]
MKEMVKERIWTYEDYLKLEDDKRYEVINGRLTEMPAPTPWHQDIAGCLYFVMRKFVMEKGIGKIYYSPIDVVFRGDVILQPDIVYVSKERLGIIGEKAIMGVPDLIVEIVSPSTTRRDTVVKKGVYENFGVKEYWIVYPEEKAVEVWVLGEKGKYELYSFAEKEGKVKSKVLEGLEVDLKEVFG